MKYLYHITHLDNLKSILESRRLWCDRERLNRQFATKGIAHEHIKRRRERRSVPLCNGGSLADYVPFYFASRSPMLYAIHNGRIENYEGGQNQILHLVSKVETVVENNLPFVFTDGHAEMATSQFYESLNDLDKIDWEVMKSKFWNDTEEDGDRKRRRQAEFLVYKHFPVEFIAGIGVISEEIEIKVKQILTQTEAQIKTAVCRNWYY